MVVTSRQQYVIRVETTRLILREFELDDIEEFAPIMADPRFMRYLYRGPQTREETLEQIKRFHVRYERDGTGPWAMIEKASHRLIGFCGLPVQQLDGVRETEVGYGLAPSSWGKGFATEAVIACRDHAFRSLGLKRLIAIIKKENLPSIRVAERAGLRLEKETTFYDAPVLVYAIQRA